jgi:hypothetical protein
MPRLTHEYVRTEHSGSNALCVKKTRGKISIEELGDYLRYDARIYGQWVIMLNASETACEVGWPTDEPKGDSILLFEIEPEGSCPICATLLPPEYCPHCGERIVEGSENG